MFEHSVKVPRHFKVVANIVKKVSTEGGSVKTLLYDNKLRHFKTNVLFALITETIKHGADIDKIFAHCQLLQTENRLDPWLAKVLTTELLFGKKTLPGKSKPEQTILTYKEQFEKYVSDHQDELKTEVAPRPRYVRINTNLLTTSDAIRVFQDDGFRFIRCTSGSYDDYLVQVQNLTEDDFTQDYHIKTIFVFAPGTKLHEHECYLKNKIILQDKATALAVHLLAPPPGSVCLDMCAAPGMKTTQLAAYLRNEGKIYAVERNEKRFVTLCEFVEKTGSTCVTTFHSDALAIRADYEDVEYILLDPSCSGSGMDFCIHNYIEDARLAKLTSLQEKFLKHAMNAFPKAKRIIYSTCSLYPEENERVITNVVKTSRAKWRVQDAKALLKGQWNNIGSGMYGSIGTRCIYSKPDTDFTTGFFLAVLDRDEKDLAKTYRQEENGASSKKVDVAVADEAKDGSKKRKNKGSEMDVDDVPKKKKKQDKKQVLTEQACVDDKLTAKKKNKRQLKDVCEHFADLSVEESGTEEVPRKKKKVKRRCEDAGTKDLPSDDISDESKKKSMKKKKKEKLDEVEVVTSEKSEKKMKKKKKDKLDEAGVVTSEKSEKKVSEIDEIKIK